MLYGPNHLKIISLEGFEWLLQCIWVCVVSPVRQRYSWDNELQWRLVVNQLVSAICIDQRRKKKLILKLPSWRGMRSACCEIMKGLRPGLLLVRQFSFPGFVIKTTILDWKHVKKSLPPLPQFQSCYWSKMASNINGRFLLPPNLGPIQAQHWNWGAGNMFKIFFVFGDGRFLWRTRTVKNIMTSIMHIKIFHVRSCLQLAVRKLSL